jgi:Ala-tRNA(Pro) deacylase
MREVYMPFSTKLQQFLEQNHVAYKHTVHPVAFTAREVASVEHLPAREVAKVVIVSAGETWAMMVLPASRALDLAEVRAALGVSQARLATEPEVGRMFPDCDLGAMPPFGNLYNMAVYVDSGLAQDDWIAFNAGSHTDVIHMRFADYKGLVKPVVLPLAREVEMSRGW